MVQWFIFRRVLYTWRGPRAHVVALRHVVKWHDMPEHSGRVERLATRVEGSPCGAASSRRNNVIVHLTFFVNNSFLFNDSRYLADTYVKGDWSVWHGLVVKDERRFGRARRRAEKKPSYIFPPAFPSPTALHY